VFECAASNRVRFSFKVHFFVCFGFDIFWYRFSQAWFQGAPAHLYKYLCIVFRRLRKIAKSDYLLCHVCLSVLPPAWNNSTPSERICTKFNISTFYENMLIILNFHSNLTRITSTLRKDNPYSFISCSFLLRIRNVSDKFAEEIKTHTLCSKTLSRKFMR
jgi:hypothetical protein